MNGQEGKGIVSGASLWTEMCFCLDVNQEDHDLGKESKIEAALWSWDDCLTTVLTAHKEAISVTSYIL